MPETGSLRGAAAPLPNSSPSPSPCLVRRTQFMEGYEALIYQIINGLSILEISDYMEQSI